MYVPNNMVFVVAGDIDRDAVVRQVAQLWSDAVPGELPELSFPSEPLPTEPRQSRGVAAVQRPRLRLAWPGTRLGGVWDYELDLLAVVLGGGESSRLVRTLRDEEQIVTTIDAFNLSFAWGEGFFGIDAEVAHDAGGASDEAAARVEARVLEMVADLARDGVTEAELAFAKRQVAARVARDGQTANGLASRLANNLIDTGDPDYLRGWEARVQQIDAVAVRDAARAILREERRLSVLVEPASEDREIAFQASLLEADLEGLEREAVDLDHRRFPRPRLHPLRGPRADRRRSHRRSQGNPGRRCRLSDRRRPWGPAARHRGSARGRGCRSVQCRCRG